MPILDEFRRRHPDIKVRAVLSGPGVMQQLSTFCAGGKCPDVLMAWELTYAELADRGVLLDLNTLLARDTTFAAELKSDSIGQLYQTFTFNGGQYAFPEQWSGNLPVLQQAALRRGRVCRRRPRRGNSHGVSPNSWTPPRLLPSGTDRAEVTQWGFVNTWVSFYSAGLFAMNNGVPWSTPRMNPTHLNFDNDAFIEAVQFYADLANKHRVAPNASETQSMATTDLFSVGKAAIALGGHWRYQTFIRADGLDFDVTPLPIGPARKGRPRARVSAPLDWPSQRAANARSRLGNS